MAQTVGVATQADVIRNIEIGYVGRFSIIQCGAYIAYPDLLKSARFELRASASQPTTASG
jgi:hypothetical protein